MTNTETGVPPSPTAPTYPYPYLYSPVPPTNVLAIVALIASFVVPLAGVICGHIALAQVKRTGENGHGLALGGVIVGYCFLAVGFLLGIIYVFFIGAAIAAGSAGHFASD